MVSQTLRIKPKLLSGPTGPYRTGLHLPLCFHFFLWFHIFRVYQAHSHLCTLALLSLNWLILLHIFMCLPFFLLFRICSIDASPEMPSLTPSIRDKGDEYQAHLEDAESEGSCRLEYRGFQKESFSVR